MQSLVYTANHKVEIMESPEPELRQGEVIIEVEASGICGSDVDGFLGRSRKRRPPLVMGHEFAGRLLQAIPSRGFGEGDLVTVMPLLGCGSCSFCIAGDTNLCPDRKLVGMDQPGAFAERVSVPEWSVCRLPSGVTARAAVMAEPMANACHIRKILGRNLPEKVLILGCGTIGMVVLGMLKVYGTKQIIAVDTNPDKIEVALKMGATEAMDAKSDTLAGQIKDKYGQIPLVIDCIGLGATRAMGIDLAGIGGKLVWIGLHDGEMAGEARDIVTKELSILGSYGYNMDDFEEALEIISKDPGLWESLVEVSPLSSGQAVFEKLVHNPGSTIKAALAP